MPSPLRSSSGIGGAGGVGRSGAILDRAVDRCYRAEPFPSDRRRVEYLFALYEQLTAPLVAAAKPARKRRRARTPA